MPPPKKRARRGGIRQRLQNASKKQHDDGEEERTDMLFSSHLVRYLLNDFAWGDMSCQKVRAIAHCALKDLRNVHSNTSSSSTSSGSSFSNSSGLEKELQALASIGSYGFYPNNCYRDIMKLIEPNIMIPPPFEMSLKFNGPIFERNQEFLLPHQTFATLWQNPATWRKVVVPREDHLLEFWKLQKKGKHPQWVGHPLSFTNEDRWAKTAPISLHGDEVPVTGLGKTWGRKMCNWSWHSLVSMEAGVQQSQHFIWGLFDKAGLYEEGPDGYRTIDKFMSLLRWSFWFLFLGIWPTEDVDGNPHLERNPKILLRGGTFLFGWMKHMCFDHAYFVQK